jgi:hypothetical protein
MPKCLKKSLVEWQTILRVIRSPSNEPNHSLCLKGSSASLNRLYLSCWSTKHLPKKLPHNLLSIYLFLALLYKWNGPIFFKEIKIIKEYGQYHKSLSRW